MGTEQEERPLRVAFQTQGCRSNYADTVDLQAALVEEGAVPCDFMAADADVYVINTCTVTDNADKEALKLIRKARERSPNSRIVITGCMAELRDRDLLALAEVDSVIGPGRKAEVLNAVLQQQQDEPLEQDSAVPDRYPSGRRPRKSLPKRKSISLDGQLSPGLAGPGSSMGEIRTRARYHLRIQEGCENACTFCIIPQTRGRLSSRQINDLLDDIAQLHRAGYREVVLTGTHIGGYGEDLGSSFTELLELLEERSAIRRIRLSSIDPNDLDLKVLDLMEKSSVFCHHLHICVQSFSDHTLKRMNRRYTMAEVEELLAYALAKLPACCFGSDLITGFPGECRQEVEQGMEAFLRLPFSYLHVFPYSERQGTAATRLDGVVDYAERKRRAARWRALAERQRNAFARSLIGQEVEIIVEQFDGERVSGTSREFVTCSMPVTKSETVRIGQTWSAVAKSYDEQQRTLLCA